MNKKEIGIQKLSTENNELYGSVKPTEISKIILSEIKVEIKPFFENVAELMAKSQLIICRSGASTVTELCAMGRPSILIPLPGSIGDHQDFNARSLEINGAAKILRQDTISAELLAATITGFINDPELCRNMAEAAGKLKKLNAATVLADRVIDEVLKSKC